MSLRPGPGWLVFAVVLSGAGLAPAAVVLTGDTYTQNFDTLPAQPISSSGVTFTWTDNVTLAGWYAQASDGTTTFRADNGSPNTSRKIYSFGDPGSSDRALGGYVGHNYWGARFLNNTGEMITSVSITYTGEQWHADSTNPQGLRFDYLVTNDLVTIGSSGWTAVTQLNFTGPTSGSDLPLDGNDPANRAVRNGVLTDLSIMPGEYFWIRWYDADHAGGDHALAIDDLSMTFTLQAIPEPATATLVLAGAGLLLGRGRRKR